MRRTRAALAALCLSLAALAAAEAPVPAASPKKARAGIVDAA
jgi:hypothetical protein